MIGFRFRVSGFRFRVSSFSFKFQFQVSSFRLSGFRLSIMKTVDCRMKTVEWFRVLPVEGLQSPRNEGMATLALTQSGFPSLWSGI